MNGRVEPYLSQPDSEVLGFKVARSFVDAPEHVPGALDFAHTTRARLLIVRCPTTEIATIHRLGDEGFRLMETQVHYQTNLRKALHRNEKSHFSWRSARPDESDRLGQFAAQSFSGSHSHYHVDPHIDGVRANAIYGGWVRRSLEQGHQVGVIEENNIVVGFGIFHINDAGHCETLLGGAGRNGDTPRIYVMRAMLLAGMEYARTLGAVRCSTATQVSNRMMALLLVRAGWEPAHSHYTFHRWMQEISR